MKVKQNSVRSRGHMIPPILRVCNGLARPADESMLARDNRADLETLNVLDN